MSEGKRPTEMTWDELGAELERLARENAELRRTIGDQCREAVDRELEIRRNLRIQGEEEIGL